MHRQSYLDSKSLRNLAFEDVWNFHRDESYCVANGQGLRRRFLLQCEGQKKEERIYGQSIGQFHTMGRSQWRSWRLLRTTRRLLTQQPPLMRCLNTFIRR